METLDLLKKAYEGYQNSYSPYSKFKVGAAILMKNGDVICGCNVENASYGLTNCAERSAIFSAISQGYHQEDFKALAVISKNKFSPCGACRQVIVELFNEECSIYISDLDYNYYEMKVKDLLPSTFSSDDLYE